MGGGRQRRRGHGGSVHVHSLVYVLAEVSSEAGWMHVYVCVLVWGGVGLKTRGPDSVAAGQIAPQKSVTAQYTHTCAL